MSILYGSALHAQDRREEAAFFIVPSAALQYGVFGDDDPEGNAGVGVGIGLQYRGTGSPALMIGSTYQPIDLLNPHSTSERAGTLLLEVGAQYGSDRLVRPSGGVELRESGGFVVFALAAGLERPMGDRHLYSPEGSIRLLGALGAFIVDVGIRLPVGAHF